MRSAFAQDLPDGGLARLDAFGQLELHQRPAEVVPRVADLEVDVARQVVGEEADTQFERDQVDAVELRKSFACDW
jgi:hypothetical protein